MAALQIDSQRELVSRVKLGLALAPGWARIGLTFGNSELREAALNDLAASIADRIAQPATQADPDQLRLAL